MWDLLKLAMISLRCIPAFFRSRSKQAIVELALRQQLATFTEKGCRPPITPGDRGFWVFLSHVWPGWKEVLDVIQPETVVRWHRKGSRLYWRSISKRGPGRPPIPAEVQALIRRFSNENGWRARKVRAELAKLGISIGLATVSRYLPKRKPDHDQGQRWKTSLHNHSLGIAAMDFLVVPTARFQLLYVWSVIDHGRRIIIHFGVTAHPTSSWVVQQLRESAASIIATSGRKQLDHCDSLTGKTGPSPSGRIKRTDRHFTILQLSRASRSTSPLFVHIFHSVVTRSSQVWCSLCARQTAARTPRNGKRRGDLSCRSAEESSIALLPRGGPVP